MDITASQIRQDSIALAASVARLRLYVELLYEEVGKILVPTDLNVS